MSGAVEPYLPFPVAREDIPLAREYRSTMLSSTVAILARRGLYDRYVAELAPEHREAITAAVPALWLPLEVGMAHYEACDRLGLSEIEQASIGWETARRFHGPVCRRAQLTEARNLRTGTSLGFHVKWF